MSTGSTKRDRKKGKHPRSSTALAQETGALGKQPVYAAVPPEMPLLGERAWLALSIAVLVAAALLRLYALDLKPMHHDEGVNGFFLEKLLQRFEYKYDPTNYHGPTLYYLTLPSVLLFGLNDFAVRLVTALFGVGTVALVLCLRGRLGAVGAIAAAALMAVSPGAVYYSRYFIHETLFVFFTLAVVVAALRFHETGRAVFLWLAAASLALLFATKETAFISAGTLMLAAAVAWGWARMRWGARRSPGGRRDRKAARAGAGAAFDTRLIFAQFGDGERAGYLVGTSLALFIFIWVLFYSSLLSNWGGVADSVRALAVWQKTGVSDFHAKPFYTYINWLWQEEAPILILGAVGSAVALFGRDRSLFAVFAGAWGFGILSAYSLIPYKTPWLAVSFIVPLALAGGYAVEALSRVAPLKPALLTAAACAAGIVVYELSGETATGLQFAAMLEARGIGPAVGQAAVGIILSALLTALGLYASRGREGDTTGVAGRRASAILLTAAALAVLTYQTYALNFRYYDDDRYPYVYSHTQREAVELVREIEGAGLRAGTRQPVISIASPDYWPLPWYFRENRRVGYEGRVQKSYNPASTLAIIGKENQRSEILSAAGENYVLVGEPFTLRPGVRLLLFLRRDLTENGN